MKSIRAKIRLCMSPTVSLSLIIVAVITMVLNYKSTLSTLQQTMTETSRIAAERVEMELESYKKVVCEVGCLTNLSDPNVSVETKKEILDQRVSTYGFQRANMIGSDGISIFDGNDYSDRSYFQEAIKGESYVSVPLFSKVTGELSVMVAAPIWEDGKPGTEVKGVVYFVPKETFLNDIITNLKVSDNGSAYILDKEGNTIANKDMEKVKNQDNNQLKAKTDGNLKEIAQIELAMTRGESGFGQYTYGEVTGFLAYAPIGGTDGWSIGVDVPQSDVMESTWNSIRITAIMVVVFATIAFFISTWLAYGISLPVKACAQRMQALVEGDLKTAVPKSRSKDETGLLMQSISNLVTGLNELIGDVDYLLKNMSEGDFSVRSRCAKRYVGDFKGLLLSVNNLSAGLSDTMREIDNAANQVSEGSRQMAESSQILAQGATQQAASIHELSGTIGDIAGKVEDTAEHAKTARNENQRSHDLIQICSGYMERLVWAMQEIDKKSQEIYKVNKTIEDIAQQTNILALNASVEAARAGIAGKGFAVVADEVRNLAGKSAEASQNTTQLIDETIKAVNEGNHLSSETDQALREVVESAQKVLDAVTLISEAAERQSQAVSQVSQGINQFSDVVQTNSATAQETAATSEELSAQSSLLKDRVGHFTLRN